MVSDKTRRDAFIEQNLGLVHACAGRFRGRGIEYDDLYSAGCMGLVKACDNFDESRGVCSWQNNWCARGTSAPVLSY